MLLRALRAGSRGESPRDSFSASSASSVVEIIRALLFETPRECRGVADRASHGGAALHPGAQRFVNRAATQTDGDVTGIERIAGSDRIDGGVALDIDLRP